MKIFEKAGKLYTITKTILGRCVCGRCTGAYAVTEYPRGVFTGEEQVKSIEGFKEVGER